MSLKEVDKMKYNNDCNINVVSIGEKLEDYLVENKGRFLGDSDEGVEITLNIFAIPPSFYDGNYRLDFEPDSYVPIPKTLFNAREQSYIEGVTTRQPLKYMLGCKVREEGVQ